MQRLAGELEIVLSSKSSIAGHEMQNKVLMEQVAQMQAMISQQQMSMQSFMAKFPQPPDEAERRLVLQKRKLMDIGKAKDEL